MDRKRSNLDQQFATKMNDVNLDPNSTASTCKFFWSDQPNKAHDLNDVEAPSLISQGPATPASINQSSTIDTIDTSDSCSPKEAKQTIHITHSCKEKNKMGKAAKKLSKPITALIGAIILATTGSAAYFFSEFLTIPGLKTQINRLEEQVTLLQSQVKELKTHVDRLEDHVDVLDNEVDRLSNETEKLEDLNDELEINIANFSDQNAKLNESLQLFRNQNTNLNFTVGVLGMEVNDLEAEVTQIESVNQRLNWTVHLLDDQIVELDRINAEISETNKGLVKSVERLANETVELERNSDMLNATVTDLQAEVSNMSIEISRLDQLSFNLANVISFFNETAMDLDQSFESFSAQLTQQVVAYRALVLHDLELLARQQASFWDCDFRNHFLLESFTQDRDAPIGGVSYPEVIEYIEHRILQEMCLNSSNFQEFLARNYVGNAQLSNVSFNQIQRAVGLYTDLAVAHYFPSDLSQKGDAVDTFTWAEANYKCANLPPSQLYEYTFS